MTLCVAGGSTVVVGFAAGLGGINSRSLGAWSEALAASAPTVVACDNFEGPSAPLAGRAVQNSARCGNFIWAVPVGDWSVASGATISDGTQDATATLPVGVTEAGVAVTLIGADTGSSAAGVVLDHDDAGTYLAAMIVGDPQVRADLVLMAGGSPTVLATADVSIGPTATVAVTRDGADVEIQVDGVSVIDFALGAGVIAILSGGDHAGLYASNTSVQFDNLRVTTPSAG
jgi:hypothetical protein